MRINELLSFFAAYLILLLSIFDAHISKIFGNISFIGIELSLLLLLLLVIVIIFLKEKISKIEIYTFLLICGVFLTSLVLNGQILTSFLGVLFLFKVFLFFIVGQHLIINESLKRVILTHVVFISVITGVVSFIQLFYSFNPFGFTNFSGKVFGILDNPNKNSIVLLVGLIISNFYLIKYDWLKLFSFIFFFFAIIVSGSRQVFLALVLILTLYYLVVRKRYFTTIFTLIVSVLFFIIFQGVFFSRFNEYDRIAKTGNYFRLKALLLSSEAIIDHPIFGVGAGFWGGKIADVYDSKYHKEYKLFAH